MPARPPVNSTCQVTQHWTVGDKAAANVLYFSFSPFGPAPLAYVTALASSIAEETAGQAALWGTDTTYLGATAVDLTNDTAFSYTASTVTPGTRTGANLPGNVALLASYAVARRFKGGHPRTYLPWLTITDVNSPQTFAGAALTAAETAWEAILAAALAATGGGYSTAAQNLVSYVLAGVPRVTPLANIISFTQCDVLIASQRRRDGRH